MAVLEGSAAGSLPLCDAQLLLKGAEGPPEALVGAHDAPALLAVRPSPAPCNLYLKLPSIARTVCTTAFLDGEDPNSQQMISTGSCEETVQIQGGDMLPLSRPSEAPHEVCNGQGCRATDPSATVHQNSCRTAQQVQFTVPTHA